MAITHHPAPESLMSCSAGSMPEAFAAVMASHIAMCPGCRKELSVMEQIGTVLFEAIAPTAVACEAEVTSMRDLQERDERQPRSDGDVPAPLVRTLGTSLDRVPWKRAGRGIWQHRIALSHEGSSTLRLIKVAAGLSLPEHGHSGSELTLVLRGSFRDARAQLRDRRRGGRRRRVSNTPDRRRRARLHLPCCDGGQTALQKPNGPHSPAADRLLSFTAPAKFFSQRGNRSGQRTDLLDETTGLLPAIGTVTIPIDVLVYP